MITLLIILGIYLLGWGVTTMVLIKYGEQWGLGGYDPPHDTWYDDYESNASAWLSFGMAWFLFVPIHLIVYLYNKLIKVVQKLIDKQSN